MDFVALIGIKPWTSTLITDSQFLHKMFTYYKENGSPEVVTNNLVILAAHVYSVNPNMFNAIKEPSYLWFFTNLVNSSNHSDIETACQCINFMLLRKESISEYFINNTWILSKFLSCSKTTDDHLKKTFLVALRNCFKVKSEEEREKYSEAVRRIFGNICTPENFPNLG